MFCIRTWSNQGGIVNYNETQNNLITWNKEVNWNNFSLFYSFISASSRGNMSV